MKRIGRKAPAISLIWVVLLIALFANAAQSQEWRLLNGAELGRVLEDKRVVYASGAWQIFHASGRTLYNAGRDSWGYWRVQGDQYCSQWPPSDLWACYSIEVSGKDLRFIGASGDITQGVLP